MKRLFSRLSRRSQNANITPSTAGENAPGPSETSQSHSAVPATPVQMGEPLLDRKIVPNLAALAEAERELAAQRPRPARPTVTIPQVPDPDEVPIIPLSPRARARRPSTGNPLPPATEIFTNPLATSSAQHYDTVHSQPGDTPDNTASHADSHVHPPTNITDEFSHISDGLSDEAPTQHQEDRRPFPTFATFGRQPSVPHITDFGESLPRPASEQSTHGTPSSSSHSYSQSTPQSNIHTPPALPASPPSSGFTFGSRSRFPFPDPSTPPPPLPPLDHPAFLTVSTNSADGIRGAQASSPRPRAQDIFQAGASSAPSSFRRTRKQRRRLRSAGSSASSQSSRCGGSGDEAARLGSPFSLQSRSEDQANLSFATDASHSSSEEQFATGPEPASAPERTPSLASSQPFPSLESETSSISKGKGKGKRTADEIDVETVTPPRERRTTFVEQDPRPGPSGHNRKRPRLSESDSVAQVTEGPPSESAGKRESLPPQPSRSRRSSGVVSGAGVRSPRMCRSRTTSTSSIPLSAVLSPRPRSQSFSQQSSRMLKGCYLMRDPSRHPKLRTTPWLPSWPVPGPGQAGYLTKFLPGVFRPKTKEKGAQPSMGWTEGGGSPLHAWLFFFGFVFFPLWWIAAVWRIPRTGKLDEGNEKREVVLDDPQIEHDARSWRFRCRVMAGLSFVTYVPFIILVAIFVPR